MTDVAKSPLRQIFNVNVVVSALGYFVDIYDLLLFGIVRMASLRSLGVPEDQLLDKGVFLINAQMAGLLTGGVLWGIYGDKKGRISVLFGSIALYSLANIANAFVSNVEMYGLLRFIAGVGLAGELGAAITLVSETMSKEHRGWGTTIIASVGILGAVVAALIGDHFEWRTAYIIGGCMGLALLVLRVSMYESGMFAEVAKSDVRKGDLRMLFHPWTRFLKYLRCIAIGVPVWFVVGILITFSPELAKFIGVPFPISAGKAIMYCYIGLSLGDLVSGWLSQVIRSRKKAVLVFLSLTTVFVCVYLTSHNLSVFEFYALCALLGFSSGYWATFVTIAAEQFGTNMRAMVTTSVPNFVRGAVVPLTLGWDALKAHYDLRTSAFIVGGIAMAIAFSALWFMAETFGKELDYVES